MTIKVSYSNYPTVYAEDSFMLTVVNPCSLDTLTISGAGVDFSDGTVPLGSSFERTWYSTSVTSAGGYTENDCGTFTWSVDATSYAGANSDLSPEQCIFTLAPYTFYYIPGNTIDVTVKVAYTDYPTAFYENSFTLTIAISECEADTLTISPGGGGAFENDTVFLNGSKTIEWLDGLCQNTDNGAYDS